MKLENSTRYSAWFLCASVALGALLAATPNALADDTGEENDFDPESLCVSPVPNGVIAVSGSFENPHAEWLFCIPNPIFGMANGILVAYAHGTVDVTEEQGSIEAIADQLEFGGAAVPGLLNQLGFSFGVVARSKTGLSVPEGIDETKRLVDLYREEIFPKYFCRGIGRLPAGALSPATARLRDRRFARRAHRDSVERG